MNAEIWQGIVIGTVGGVFAGLAVSGMTWLARLSIDRRDRAAIRRCLQVATMKQKRQHFPAKNIAAWTHMPISRVEKLCSTDKRILMGWKSSTGEQVWRLRDQ